MKILIGCAKDMTCNPVLQVPRLTTPNFIAQARQCAVQMAQYGAPELKTMLGVSDAVARETARRYQQWTDTAQIPAVLAYNGVVFKHLGLEQLLAQDFEWMQEHVLITSFLYGLLRPLDGIALYRLEGRVQLPQNGCTMFAFWRPLLTQYLIDAVKADGGVLVDLASNEMRDLFDWKRVEHEVKVVKPDFLVSNNGVPRRLSVWAKKGRGAMTGFAVRGRIDNADALQAFDEQGYVYSPSDSTPSAPVFVAYR